MSIIKYITHLYINIYVLSKFDTQNSMHIIAHDLMILINFILHMKLSNHQSVKYCVTKKSVKY